MPFVTVQGHRLEFEFVGAASAGAPDLVFLHEGLGSVALWQGFPARVAAATGCRALVYSRRGYGQSDSIAAPRPVRFMHDEALAVLPELLDRLEIEDPVLFGHSDGASIALIHAGSRRRPVAGVIAMAPHVFVEDVTIRSIEAARLAYETTDLRARLGRYHADPDSAFRGWNDVWLDPAFRAWSIEEYLPAIGVPVLAIQGEDDEYGTLEQVDRIARQVSDVELLKLAGCRHSPHRDRPDEVIAAAARFLGRLHRQDCGRSATMEQARAASFVEMSAQQIEEVARLVADAMNPDEGAWAARTLGSHFRLREAGLPTGREYHVLELDGAVAGITGLHHYEWGPDENVWLGWFAVGPLHQGTGTGALLMRHTEELARRRGYRKLFVETYDAPAFQRAIRFYERAGFRRAGRIDRYLPDGSPMLVFLKDLG